MSFINVRSHQGLMPRHQSRITLCAAASAQSAITDSKTKQFLTWAKDTASISFDNLTPAVFPGAGRGLAASAPIKSDQVVLSVPRESALTLAPRQICPFPEFVKPGKDYWDKAPWFVKLGLMLLHQQQQQQQGATRMGPYLSQLPERVPLPFFWDDETLQQLQYPLLIKQVRHA